MSETEFAFEHQGRTVRPGQVMHLAPQYWQRAGAQATVERYYGDSVMLRTDNSAVPTVPLDALSWEPHAETLAMEGLRVAGFARPTLRDVAVWIAARHAALAASPNTGEAK